LESVVDGEADLVVVGAGVAGWTAARRAQQLGLRVSVLEKFGEGPGLGNGRMSGGVFHAGYLDPLRPPEDLWKIINWATDQTTRADVARTWADNCGRAVAFLMAEGAQFGQRGYFEWNRRTLMPFGNGRPGLPAAERWPQAGPDRLLTKMWKTFVANGGDFQPGAAALELIESAGAVVGVRTAAGDVRGKNVLISDGGYHSNTQMGAKYYGSSEYAIRASQQNTGDGLNMALAAGASTTNLDQFYGHLQHRAALDSDRFWPRPGLDYIGEAGLLVTASGRRIGTTGATFMHLVHEIVRSESPSGCWIVLDAVGWKTIGELDGDTSPAVAIPQLGLRLEKADSVAELAASAGLPAEALSRSVEQHNAEYLRPLDIPFSGEGLAHPPPTRVKIAEPPFYAVPTVVGITFGLGGILVNGNGAVLRGSTPIPGLFAAGNTMGGLQGGPNFGYSGGWSQASVFGLAVAEHVAARP
jgi:fumarate reductase flavoprotein subunit